MSKKSNISKMAAMESQKLLLNQVRHRILQYMGHHGSVTVREIGAALPDIPQATMYRQVKLLNESGLIRVCGERQIRGTLEHTYRLADELTGTDAGRITDTEVQFKLLGLAQDFADYYTDEGADPARDMLSITSVPLMMSDEEFSRYMQDVEKLTRKYEHNIPSGERRIRRVTLISSPA